MIGTFVLTAQSDVQLSQQMFSKINTNPATTGISNYAHVFLFARQQWVGVENAPSTQMLNIQSYIEDIKSGLGFTITNDAFALTNTINAKFAYAYHVQTSRSGYFSMGLNIGVLYKRYNGSEIIFDNDGETQNYLVNEGRVRMDFDLGIAYTSKQFSTGLSATHISNYIYTDDIFTIPMHFYYFAEYNFIVNKNFSLLSHLDAMCPIDVVESFDYFLASANLTGTLYNKFWVGFAYRLTNVGVVLAGINLGPDFKIGYSYDFSLGTNKVSSKGSHEIMLTYRMKIKEDKGYGSKTPRFFD